MFLFLGDLKPNIDARDEGVKIGRRGLQIWGTCLTQEA